MVLEMSEHGYNLTEMEDRQGLYWENDFLAAGADRTLNRMMTGETFESLSYQNSHGELGTLSTYMCHLGGSHYILIRMDTVYDFRNVRASIYY